MQLVKWVMGTDMREKDVAVVACTGVGALGVGTGLSKVLSRRIQMFMLCSKVLSKEELDFRDICGVLGVGFRV